MATQNFESPYSRLIAIWTLRALSPGLGRAQFLVDYSYSDTNIAQFLGLPANPDAETFRSVPRLMNDLSASLEKSGQARFLAKAQKNFDQFAEALKLDSTEQRILEWFACMEVESNLDIRPVVKQAFKASPIKFIAKILNIAPNSVAKAIAPSGRLMKCGLLKQSSEYNRHGCARFYSETIARQLMIESYDPSKLLKSFGVTSPSKPDLVLDDYEHIEQSLDLLLPYMDQAVLKRKRGVNVLIYGAPGTGKTQLVKVIAKALGLAIYELDTADEDRDALSAGERFSVLNMAQTYFQDASVILVFDEAEDILTPSLRDPGKANTHKAWFNHLLENNPQPVFWISNDIDSLDPAFSRRFDFIIEVPIPPKNQREKILQKQVGKLISPALIKHFSEVEDLAPAVITRVRDVMRAIGNDLISSKRDAAFSHLVGGILKAQGHANTNNKKIQPVQADIYDIANLNTTADLQQLSEQLRKHPSARLCLYGPPGTGKTAFGHWLAAEIDAPLYLKKASDLLSPYVGMTEQLISKAFQEAKEEDAILMVDEVDSFLQDRTQSKNFWEITGINEMLTQIDSYPGIMIATTNLLDRLDPASLRRFDLKLEFGFLHPVQVRRLLSAHCRNLELPPPTPQDLAMAESIETATPGDFASVARQHRFQPFCDAQALLFAVIRESDHKITRSRKIGFR
jgi:SpoVK/Ycf46/Vps4 family AAA+-type ATPase